MPNSINTLTTLLITIIFVILLLLIILAIVYFTSKNKKQKQTTISMQGQEKEKEKKSKTFAVQSVMDFMEFDKIEDNMIVQKNGDKYIMVVECQGINYDLMSEVEKNSVEEGFIQFLNTLRYPVQIYIQTRTINLGSSIQTYKESVKKIEENFQKQQMQYKDMVNSGAYTTEQLNSAFYELTKQKNLNEYGKDIIYNTEKMSLNKNVLNQKYYIIVPYYPEDLGQNDFDKEEIKNLAFSELYTRCQSILRTLSGSEIKGKVLTSNELADLLYVAYNRDESETYGLDKALRAGFDELYSTAPDVLDKKMRALDAKIEQEAFNKANEMVIEAQSEKARAVQNKEKNINDLIDKVAKMIIEQNKEAIGKDVAENAIDKIDEDSKKTRGRVKKAKEEGGTQEDVQEKTKRRRTKTA